MEISSKQTLAKNNSPALPKLKDPKHPGMFLISRISLFSLALFTLLIATSIYMAATVSLDIELSLSGAIKPNNEFVLYAEVSRAMVIEPGQKAEITLSTGARINAEVTEVQEGLVRNAETVSIILKPTGEYSAAVKQFIRVNNGATVSATVFTRHSLWTFLKEKVDY
ncbi:MAG: hypothetical protein HEP71_25580 [Roseivirga sp.]|nr:hypothetical protein [Roseivirga sp.]